MSVSLYYILGLVCIYAINLSDAESVTVTESSITENCINLISIERTPTPEGNRFTIRFTKNREDVEFKLADSVGSDNDMVPTQRTSSEVWSLSFTPRQEVGPHQSAWLLISDADYETMFALKLNNSDTTADEQTFPEVPFIEITPSGDVGYSPGTNVSFEISVATENENQSMPVYFSGVDLETGEYKSHFDRQQLFSFGDVQRSEGATSGSFTMLTSTNKVSGYIQINLDLHETGGLVVPILQVSRHVTVHPSNQSGVFPPGYLAMVDLPYSTEVSKNDNVLVPCRVGQECPINCGAVGNTISSLEVAKVNSDGSLSDVPSTEMSSAGDSYVWLYWRFTAESDSGDSDGITTFRCRATDDTYGNVVTKLIDVQATITPTIDAEDSGIDIEDDHMDPHRKTIILRCSIIGRPTPDVTFNFDHRIYWEAPDTVVQSQTTPNKVTVTKSFNVDLYRLAGDITPGEPFVATCEFFAPFEGSVSHSLDVSPIILEINSLPTWR